MIVLLLAAIASETVLPSGATMFHIERKTPYASFAIALPLGSDADPPGKAGLARAAAIALEEHIRAMTADERPRAFEELGGSIAVRTGPMASILYGGAPADRFDEAMAIVFRGIAQVKVDEKIAVARAAAERMMVSDDIVELARFEARRALFGGASAEGELARSDLEGILAERTKAGSIVFAIAGDAALIANAAAWTQPLPAGKIEAPRKRSAPVARARGRRVVVIDRTGEALILIARPLAPPSEERLPAMLAAASSLDVFGARVELEPAAGFASIAVRVRDGAIAKTTRSALSALDKSRHGPSLDAIAVAKKRAATRADVALADPSTHTLAVAAAKVQGRPWVSAEQLSAKILATGDAEVASAARILASGDDLAIVVVASATQELVRELAGIPGIRDVSIVNGAR